MSAVQHSSESAEHYTPSEIVEAARTLMGGIDLDPASCALAQQTVRAETWWGPECSPCSLRPAHDGLSEQALKHLWSTPRWRPRVFLNPPGGLIEPDAYPWTIGTRSSAAYWWGVYAREWISGTIDQMVFIGFTLELLRSTQDLKDCPAAIDFPMCVPKSRIDFETFNRERTKGKKKGELIDPKSLPGERIKQGAPGHANVILWLPPLCDRLRDLNDGDIDAMTRAFSKIGRCRA